MGSDGNSCADSKPSFSPQRSSISDPAATEDNTADYQTWDRVNPTAGQPPGGLNFQRYPGNSRNPYLQAWNVFSLRLVF
jgi:hypothetical protein